MRLAFLSQTKLYLLEAGQKPRCIESQFGNQMVQRSLEAQEKNAWKNSGDRGGFLGGRQLWGVNSEAGSGQALPIRISSVASAPGGDLIYALETPSIGGLFIHHLAEKGETRLFHRESFSIQDLDRNQVTGKLLGTMPTEVGTANLALSDPDGRNFRELTEGDSIDAAPSWVEGSETLCVFQSAGVGRDSRGERSGLGAFCVERLDLDSGEMETVAEESGTDLLQPHEDAEGNLYFIRRPYQGPHGAPVKWTTLIKDVFLFPFRLVRAIIHFLNTFSLFFSKQPLISAGGPKRDDSQDVPMMVWGRWIDMKAELRKQGNDAGNLVPASWELVRRSASGTETVLAKNVLAYDLQSDGTLVYTNGSTIFAGKTKDSRMDFQKIGEASAIEAVKLL